MVWSNTRFFQGGEGWREGIIMEFGIDMYTLLFKKDNQQGPTV